MRPRHLMTWCQKLAVPFMLKDIQELMIASCKYLYGLSAPVMKKSFTKKIIKYNVRSCRVTLLPNPKIEIYCTKYASL